MELKVGDKWDDCFKVPGKPSTQAGVVTVSSFRLKDGGWTGLGPRAGGGKT